MRLGIAAPGCVLLAVALTVVAHAAMTAPADPQGETEATYRLQAESLARDADFVYGERDRLRFKEHGWDSRSAKAVVSLERDSVRYQRPAPYALALAPFVRFGPERGPFVLQLGLLLALTLMLLGHIARDSPNAAPYWTLALLFGTPVFSYTRAVWPELFVATLLAGAYLLTRDRAASRDLPAMAPAASSPLWLAVRWACVGGLAALVVLQDPLYAVFLPAFLAASPRVRRELAWASAITAFTLVLVTVWIAGASIAVAGVPFVPETGLGVRPQDALADVAEWTRRLATVEPPAFVVDPQLWLWNLVYAAVGRSVGLAAALVALLAFALAGSGRRAVIWSAAAAVALLAIVLDPFNFFGGPEALGNRRLLPAAVACFFAVRASVSVWPAVVAACLGFAALAPLWFGLATHPIDLRDTLLAAPIAAYLPFESSQRYAPVSGEFVGRHFLVRPVDDAIEPSASGGQFVLQAGREGRLMVAAAPSVNHLDLEFGAQAGSELIVRGGVVEDLLFRPDGGVTFRVRVDDGRIRHRLWRDDGTYEVHMLRLTMPESGPGGQPFSIGLEGPDS